MKRLVKLKSKCIQRERGRSLEVN